MADYSGPGNTGELTGPLVQKWTDKLSDVFDQGIAVAKSEPNPPSQDAWLFNPISSGTNGTSLADIKWNAFPKRLLDNFGSKLAAWREGDTTRGRHEEYCEWEVVRDPQDFTIGRVTFTTETPEYYEFLFEEDQGLLLSLYHRFVSPEVQIDDLHVGGKYNKHNIWNWPESQGKRGVLMHMGFGPNTLGAAVNLSAEATWPSVDGQGNLITDEQGLIDCRKFGARQRHSDPHIGAQINALARAGNEVSFASPTGLYIDSIDLSGFTTPDGSPLQDLVRVVRGDADHMMRVVFEAPSNSGFRLGDVKVDGNPIRFGGQIAEKLTIRIRGLARARGESPPTIDCSGSQANPDEFLNLAGLSGTRRGVVEFLVSDE